jgi:dipeptidyl aminopeptidase/acylaminoacyl peptidase
MFMRSTALRLHSVILVALAATSMSAQETSRAAGTSAGVRSAAARQGPVPAPLTLNLIARDTAKWIGESPSDIRWSADSRSIYFQWNPDAKETSELFSIAREGGTPSRVPLERHRMVAPADAKWNRARSMKVYAAYGDIFVITTPEGTVRRLTETEATEQDPRFTFDDTAVTFERDQNLFLVDLKAGTERQISNFRTGRDPNEKPRQTELQEYLKKQQLDLFEYVRKQERLGAEQKEREPLLRGRTVAPYYLKDTQRVSDLQLSPDNTLLTFILADRSDAAQAKVVDMPNYVTSSGFVEMRRLSGGGELGRVKAGEPVITYRLGAVTLADGRVSWVDHGQKDRAVNFNAPVWSDDGRRAVAWAGATNHKDAWLLLLDLPSTSARVVAHEHDDAWVRGFRTGRAAAGDNLEYGWMPDHNRVYFLSERDGYHHLYIADLSGGAPRQVTRGRFELSDLLMSQDKTKWYFVSNEVHPGEHQVYSMALEGGERTRLTSKAGWYEYVLSPDEQHIALSYSGYTEPAELYVMANRAAAPETRITTSTKSSFTSYPWQPGEIVTFPDQEGHTIYADLWRPARPHPTRPAVIFVHGSGWAQGVYRRWSNNTPFFHYLLQEGFVVLNLDYRGSRGYGRDFRTGIYRHMGDTEIKSGLAAVEYLVAKERVDRRRIGLFGGSYGGFYTLMALFKHPGVFAAGAVRAPVTDWAHYNPTYTTRILNAPYADHEAYARSSPIYLAEGLQDHLLIQHGMLDDNVHFQDSVRLAQRLLELKKDNWEFIPYPIEAHALNLEEYNRLDVMRRRVKLFNSVLKGPRPAPATTSQQ